MLMLVAVTVATITLFAIGYFALLQLRSSDYWRQRTRRRHRRARHERRLRQSDARRAEEP